MDAETHAKIKAFLAPACEPDDDVIKWLRVLFAEVERLRAAILDIDAYSTPLGEDADGFVSTGYLVSVGSLHRALGLVGHTAAPMGADALTDLAARLRFKRQHDTNGPFDQDCRDAADELERLTEELARFSHLAQTPDVNMTPPEETT